MRKHTFILSALVALAAFSSCSKEYVPVEPEIIEPVVEESIPFVLNAEAVDTKALFGDDWRLSWEKNDYIFAVTTDQEWSSYTIFTYNGTAFTTTKTISNGTHTFNFIYAPFAQRAYHTATGTKFNISETQGMSTSNPKAGLKNYYPLAGQATLTTPTASLDAKLNHLATIVKVTVKNMTGAAIKVNSLRMDMPAVGIAGLFKVDFEGTPSLKRIPGTINLTSVTNLISGGVTLGVGEEIPVYFVIAPVDRYNGDIIFTAETSTKKYVKSKPVVNVTFRAGTYNSATYVLE